VVLNAGSDRREGTVDAVADPSSQEDVSDAVVTVGELVKSYPAASRNQPRVAAVRGISFDVGRGEFFTLLGPSGCGKTTTLRCIAGLEDPDAGSIVFDGRTLYSSQDRVNIPANERMMGMVFQSYAIWPHMTVAENVSFPLRVMRRRQRPSRSEITERVLRALATVELDGLEKRRATDLSGGQQQRLALARALVAESPLMLLDEPLSNLDAKLRETMRFEIKRLQRELRFTAMYVTHDQVEALALSTRIAVVDEGVIQQIGRPRDIYENPATKFVASFIGRSNFLEGSVTALPSGDLAQVETRAGTLLARTAVADLGVGDAVTIGIRPEHIQVDEAHDGPAAEGSMEGTVETRQFLGEFVDHIVSLADVEIQVRSNPSISYAPGTKVRVTFPPEHTRVLNA
jgi:iron(III) transport system ATP-binding protein